MVMDRCAGVGGREGRARRGGGSIRADVVELIAGRLTRSGSEGELAPEGLALVVDEGPQRALLYPRRLRRRTVGGARPRHGRRGAALARVGARPRGRPNDRGRGPVIVEVDDVESGHIVLRAVVRRLFGHRLKRRPARHERLRLPGILGRRRVGRRARCEDLLVADRGLLLANVGAAAGHGDSRMRRDDRDDEGYQREGRPVDEVEECSHGGIG